MKRYFKFEETPVEFDGTAEKLKKFKADNNHLTEIEKAEFDQLNAENQKDEQRRKRRNEYPAIGDQLDAIMKWAFTETEIGLPAELKSLAAKCMAIKSKYPIEKE